MLGTRPSADILTSITGSGSAQAPVAERPVALPPDHWRGAMTDIEKYRRGTEHCARMAGAAVTNEIRELWLTIEQTYRFLLDREERNERDNRPT